MNAKPLPPTIIVQLPSGIKIEATLLKWPHGWKPVYAISFEQLENANVLDLGAPRLGPDAESLLESMEKALRDADLIITGVGTSGPCQDANL